MKKKKANPENWRQMEVNELNLHQCHSHIELFYMSWECSIMTTGPWENQFYGQIEL